LSSHAKPSNGGAAGAITPAEGILPTDVGEATVMPDLAGAPFTLGVDIGGTYIKASVVDRTGTVVAAQLRAPTPKRATPDAVLAAIAGLVVQLPRFDRISIGFPGVLRGGEVLTAPNLGTEWWTGFQLIDAMSKRYGTPTRTLNDAAVQGLGVVQGEGLECVLTLGTGIGCALFRNRRLLLHLEFGQLRAKRSTTYDRYIGQAALTRKGPKRWNRRLLKAIGRVTDLTSCDTLYIGGGNSRKIAVAVPPHVKIVSNVAGITGGVRLWEPELDELFAGEEHARAG
jgi:polyphosphate glucokinase